MNDKSRVLVVDDEKHITELVAMALRYASYEVAVADSGFRALELIREFRPNLVILDVMMKGLDGFEVAQRARDGGENVPILFLTARDTTADKVHGLSVGDDYLTKPFSLEELVARVGAILRRSAAVEEPGTKLTFADLELDEDTREVWRAGEPIDLTATEYRLLRYLLLNPRRVLTRGQILSHVWGYDGGTDAPVLETYISYLRRKIDSIDPPLIHTIRGVGYSMRLPQGSR